METDKLIDLLNKEREYHSNHPVVVYSKFIYSLGASLAAIVSSLYFSDKFDISKFRNLPIELILTLFSLGLVLLIIGLMEHTWLHYQQRDQIENAINDILEKSHEFKYSDFWSKYRSHSLSYLTGGGNSVSKTPLFTLEPDKRTFWYYHDRKIDLGIILILAAYLILIYKSFFIA